MEPQSSNPTAHGPMEAMDTPPSTQSTAASDNLTQDPMPAHEEQHERLSLPKGQISQNMGAILRTSDPDVTPAESSDLAVLLERDSERADLSLGEGGEKGIDITQKGETVSEIEPMECEAISKPREEAVEDPGGIEGQPVIKPEGGDHSASGDEGSTKDSSVMEPVVDNAETPGEVLASSALADGAERPDGAKEIAVSRGKMDNDQHVLEEGSAGGGGEELAEQSSPLAVGEDSSEHFEAEESAAYRYTLADEVHQLTKPWKCSGNENYFRGCKWAPDGSCILTCNNDNRMRLFNLPAELYSNKAGTELLEMTPALTVPLGESVYDFCWYPRMSSWEPETCCFLSTCKDHPIHLWDAFHHQNRASYVTYNHLDEVVSTHSVAFSLDGERIFAGLAKSLKIFHLNRPGRECTSISLYNKKTGGQSGIISCISMSPVSPGVYALGSYSCSAGVYSEDTKGAIFVLSGINSGVTHMMFSEDGQTLYTGFRKESTIMGWDLRNPGRVLHKMERAVNTNQRIYFDSFSNGRYLVSGATDGCVYGWDVKSERMEQQPGLEGEPVLEPLLHHRVHADAVNGTSVHPTLPILATCSGQRRFSLGDEDCSDGEGSGSDQGSDKEEGEETSSKSERRPCQWDSELNCLKLWSLTGS